MQNDRKTPIFPKHKQLQKRRHRKQWIDQYIIHIIVCASIVSDDRHTYTALHALKVGFRKKWVWVLLCSNHKVQTKLILWRTRDITTTLRHATILELPIHFRSSCVIDVTSVDLCVHFACVYRNLSALMMGKLLSHSRVSVPSFVSIRYPYETHTVSVLLYVYVYYVLQQQTK